MRSRQQMRAWTWLAVAAVSLGGCDLDKLDEYFTSRSGQPSDIQDRSQTLTRQDYRDLNKIDKLLPKDEIETSATLGAPPIPDLAQVLAAPKAPKVANTKLVTLSVTDDVPLRDVLFELGRLANVDMEVGAGLDKQGINLRATDRPFNEVIERIADLGSLRYSMSGNSLRVERDTPYIKTYKLDFINIVRSSTSSYTLSTSILSGGGSSSSGSSSSGSSGGSSSVGTSGSSSSITAQAESDLWSSMEASLKEILNYMPEVGTSAGPVEEKAAKAGESKEGQEAPPAPVAAKEPKANTEGKTGGESSFVINRQAGLLSVNATDRQHEMVRRFLDILALNISAQVLIEAKIVEVSLRDQFLSGVNWDSVIGNLGGVGVDLGTWTPPGSTGFALGSSNSVQIGLSGGDLGGIISLTERFGTTRTLSSPRLNAINNQQAVLTFAQNRVFFDCEVSEGSSTSTTGGTSTTTSAAVDCNTNSVPVGIILSILPSINLESQEVTLSVRPTLTRQVSQVDNPGVRIAAATYNLTNVSSAVPVIEVRELDSVMKVRSGGVMIIGGLMEDSTATQNDGIPGVSEAPLFGSLFKSRDEDSQKRELIILIKATIVNPDGNLGKADRAIVDRFTTDPRPLFVPKSGSK